MEDDRSDIQIDMDVLSEARDTLISQISGKMSSANKVMLINSLLAVIKARQESELLQLRIWGMLEEHDENCPECNEVESSSIKNPSDSN